MRLFVALALSVFTGCQAKVLWSGEPMPKLDVVKDAFWDYFSKATEIAQNTVETIVESELGQLVIEKIDEIQTPAKNYEFRVYQQAPPILSKLYKKVSEKVDRLAECLQPYFKKVKDQIEPYTVQLKANIKQRMGILRQVVVPYVESLDTKVLNSTFERTSSEVFPFLIERVKEVTAQLGPSTEDLREKVRQHLEEFQERSLVLNLRLQLAQREWIYFKILRPYTEDLQKKLMPYAEELYSQIISFWRS